MFADFKTLQFNTLKMAQEGCQVLEAKEARGKVKELAKEVEVRSKKC